MTTEKQPERQRQLRDDPRRAGEVREIVRRFNDASRAFDEAITASQARDVTRYEAALLRSAREMGSALELAVVRLVRAARPELVSQRLDFPALVDHLVGLRVLSLDGGRADQLKRWRRLRNEAEHAPVRVPPLSSLLEALRGVRRFLQDALATATDLADPDHPSRTPTPAGEEQAATAVPLDYSHREEDPDAWVIAQIDEGLGRLNAGRAESPPLSRTEVRHSLLGLARDLVEQHSAPGEVIPCASVSARALDAHRRLYVEAGWLADDGRDLRFRDPRLPALLLGLDLRRRGIDASERRAAMASMGAWAETAWAATAAGDLPHDWLRCLLGGSNLYGLPDQVVTGCAAIAGLGTFDRVTADLVERVAQTAAEALVWLIPLPQEKDGQPSVQCDVWRLPVAVWQRAVLDLAKATRESPGVEPPQDTRSPVRAVARLFAALGLAPRVTDATARAVRLLCCPWPRGSDSPLDKDFFQALWSLRDGVARHVEPQFTEIWMAEAGIPALWKGDARRTARLLVVAGSSHPAGFLLNRPGLISYWCEAWVCFAETEPADEAARAWVSGATWVARTGGLDEGLKDFFLHDAPVRLRELGAWEVARAQLEESFGPDLVRTHPDEQQISYGAGIFAMADLSPETWRHKISEWGKGPNLPWRVLLAAGVPHDAIACWCLDKLREKDSEKLKLDGPLGVIASPGAEIIQTEGWQLAFNQAGEALEWLLDHGDESAVAVLANTCFEADDAGRFDPFVGSLARLGVSLSQVLWGRVIGRAAGRAALYARVEAGKGLGSNVHFLPGTIGFDPELWATLAEEVGLRPPPDRTPDASDTTEARRLLAAFERWIVAQPAGLHRLAPERDSWVDPAMRPAKALMLMCGALCGLDVTERLYRLLRGIIDDGKPDEVMLLKTLGLALNHLCGRSVDPPEALLMLAAKPEVAAHLNSDSTKAFWAVLLRRLGVDEVLKLADLMAVSDLGLGFLDALVEAAPHALDRCQERPDLLRAVLVRSTDGNFAPSQAFHQRAWEQSLKPEDIPDLDRIPAGGWLASMIQHSRRWAEDERDALLRWLAQRSCDAEVRRRCLEALLEHV